MELSYEHIKFLKEEHPTIKLIQSNNAPLIISFLYLHFKRHNNITVTGEDITQKLLDYLNHLKQVYGDGLYSDSAKNYLDKWTEDGYLRKYYSTESDDPIFELTPAAEKSIELIQELNKKEFVGTESRLLRIFDLLKKIVYQTSEDLDKRLSELNKQKDEIEIEIQKIRSGNPPMLTDTQIKENYYEVYETARKLLSDFRQVEYNFRDLNRSVKEKQIQSTSKKGQVLDDIFKIQDSIWDTDQGRSFRAFWEFLMSQTKQDELNILLENSSELIGSLNLQQADDLMDRLKVYLIDAGDKVNRTNHQFIEQLRKFLDERTLKENKRIQEIIDEIKVIALEVKNIPPKNKDFLSFEYLPFVELVMERPLWTNPQKAVLDDLSFEEGDSSDMETSVLFKQFYVNPDELKENIRNMLRTNEQVSLKQISDVYPIQKGLSEAITYLSIASKDKKAIISDDLFEEIQISNSDKNKYFSISIPKVIFIK
ncbi:MAG: DUF3375 domain-containing protein [Leptospiraceae bacterium]|nr:DUF3375 domain-containing protein [Leptospiraceae bacterium]MCP5497361.1 DUF3375 domain-containing protein [Leptospiraceae bacterium]